MAVYAIGDVQGCFDELQALLEHIHYEPAHDTLWFCGDLVNRGNKSLETLRFVRSLGERAITVLGNHDLHLIATASGYRPCKGKDTLDAVPDLIVELDQDMKIVRVNQRFERLTGRPAEDARSWLRRALA